MATTIFGIFIILHGLVHGLYAGQALRWFELRPGMAWPDHSRPLGRLFNANILRGLAGAGLIITLLGFGFSGVTCLLGVSYWYHSLIAASAISTLIFLIFWDGTHKRLDDQGGIGILINIALTTLSVFMVHQGVMIQ